MGRSVRQSEEDGQQKMTQGVARLVLGVSINRSFRKIRAAAVEMRGQGRLAPIRVIRSIEVDIQPHTRNLLFPGSAESNDHSTSQPELADKTEGESRRLPSIMGDPHLMERLTLLRQDFTEQLTSALGQLVTQLGRSAEQVLFASVVEPGMWMTDDEGRSICHELCDPAVLARWTGLNVLDGFAGHDIAQGGVGGPIVAAGEWRLLHDTFRRRILLRLGETTRMTYMPEGRDRTADRRIVSMDIGPGMGLLNRLARYGTAGKCEFDAGGRLAVGGRRVQPLIDDWLSDPFFERGLPRWSPVGVDSDRFYRAAIAGVERDDWTTADALCSATHFIAQASVAAIRRFLPPGAPADEIVIASGGRKNGLLLSAIRGLIRCRLLSLESLGYDDQTFGPAAAAILGLMYLDGQPASSTSLTASDVSRTLGRLTPGAPAAWQHLLTNGFRISTKKRSLRSAM